MLHKFYYTIVNNQKYKVLLLYPSCNLAADSFDFGVFGTAGDQTAELGATDGEKGRGGHGIFRDGAKEPPPPSASVAVAAAKALGGRGGGKAAAAKHAAIETLRSTPSKSRSRLVSVGPWYMWWLA